MNNNNHLLFPSTEVVSSFLSYECERNDKFRKSVEADVKSAILAITNIDFRYTAINIVENTESDIALVLPYYTALEKLEATIIPDENLHAVGGEIMVAVLSAFGAIGYMLGIGAAGAATLTGFTASAVIAGAAVVAVPIAATATIVGASATAAAIAGIDKIRTDEIRNGKSNK